MTGTGTEKDISTIDDSIRDLQRKRHDIMIKVYNCTDSVYTDQTGQFLVTSSRRNKYIMVLCEIDGNQILVESMTNRTEGTLIKTHKKLIERLKSKGIHPKIHYLDNEVSEAYKEAIRDMQMEYQLITPHVHRANIAEKAIQTFKGHFISIMARVDDSFPLHLWCRLLPQAEMTLNMLKPANVSPNILAYMYANGNHDYNTHPLAPLGCKVLIHETPDNRHTWDAHAMDVWYIGTLMEHYGNHIVWCKDTRAERISDTVWFKHKYLTNPEFTAADAIADAAHKLTKTALEANPPTQIPSTNKEALAKLADIFTQAAKKYSDKEARKSAALPGVERQSNPSREAASPGVHRRSGAIKDMCGTSSRGAQEEEH